MSDQSAVHNSDCQGSFAKTCRISDSGLIEFYVQLAISWQFRLHAPPVGSHILQRVAEFATIAYDQTQAAEMQAINDFLNLKTYGGQSRERKPKSGRRLRA